MKANTKQLSNRKFAAAGLALVAAFSSVADPTLWYPNSTWSESRNTAFMNATMWSTADGTPGTSTTSLNATDDYINKNKTIRFGGQTFTGRLLQIGVVDVSEAWITYDGQTSTFPDEGGLVLAKGNMNLNHSWSHDDGVTLQNSVFNGLVTVTATESAPFLLKSSQYANRRMIVSSGLHAERGTGFRVRNAYRDGERQNLGLCLPVATDFKGVLSLNSLSDYTADGRPGVFLELGETTLAGTLRAENLGVVVRPITAGNSYKVGTLEMGDKARLNIAYASAKATNTLVTVTNAFTVLNGKPEIYISGFPNYGNEATRWPILRVPAESELSDDTFSLAGDTKLFGSMPLFSLKAETEGSVKTLYLCRPAVKLQTTSDNNTYNDRSTTYVSSLETPERWRDGELPDEGDIAVVSGMTLRGIETRNLDYEFPGDRLVFYAANGGASGLVLRNTSFSADMLVLCMLSLRPINGLSVTLRGNVVFGEGGGISCLGYNSSLTKFEAEISGPGSIEQRSRVDTSAPNGYIEFTATNVNWTGRFALRQTEGTNGSDTWPSPTKRQNKVYVSDERNLGGRLEAFDYAALTLAHYGILEPRCPVAFTNDYNRGILIGDYGAEITTPEGCDIICTRTITVDGAFVKTGPGTLALGGDVKFLAYEEGNTYTNYMYYPGRVVVNTYNSIALTDTPPAEEYKRHFAVTNGYLKAMSAGCVDGLTVDFTPAVEKVGSVNVPYDTGLKLDFSPADAELKAHGVRNVKTDAPFVLGSDGLKVVIENTPAEGSTKVEKLGIATVKTSAAGILDGRISVSRVPGYSRRIVREDDAEAGTTTFSVELEKTGFMLVIE